MNSRFVLCATIVWLSACVSSKKYQALHTQYENLSQRLLADTLRLTQRNSQLLSAYDSLSARHAQLETNYLQATNEATLMSQNYRRNKALLDELFERYDRLDKSFKQLSNTLSSDAVTLSQNSSQKEKELLILEQKILAQQSKNDKLSAELEEREVKMLAFENSIQKMDKTASDLKTRLQKALAPLKDTTLRIEQRAGRVMLSFPVSSLAAAETLSEQEMLVLKKTALVYKGMPDFTYQITSVLPWALHTLSPEPAVFRHLQSISAFLSKEGVTSNKIILSARYRVSTEETKKKASTLSSTYVVELTAEPKLDTMLQYLQNN